MLERQQGVVRITEVVLRPMLTLPAGSDPGVAERVLEKSAKLCFVPAPLSAPVRLEPRRSMNYAAARTPFGAR